MDWRKLKIGQVLWYVNTSRVDRLDTFPRLELWRGVVKSIKPEAGNPVRCEWDRVGGYANWIAPEYCWHNSRFIDGRPDNVYENPHVFPTAEAAIEAYLQTKREKLMADAKALKSNCNHRIRVLFDNY